MKRNIGKGMLVALAASLMLGGMPIYGGTTQSTVNIQSEYIAGFEETLKIAHLDYETASEEMKAKILRARYEVIFAPGVSTWGFNPDGSVPTIIDVDGSEIEIPSFEETFPGWCFVDIMTFKMQDVYIPEYKGAPWSFSAYINDTQIQIPNLDMTASGYTFKEIEALVKQEINTMYDVSQARINWEGNARPPFANDLGTSGANLGPQFELSGILNQRVVATFVSGPSQMPTVNLGFWNVSTNSPGVWRAGVGHGQMVEMTSVGQRGDTHQTRVSTSERDNGLANFRIRTI